MENKVAFITGASSGIGEACAKALANAGIKVTLVARRKDRIDALAQEIGKDNALSLLADVTNHQQMQAAIDATINKWGKIDILVNNAGVMYLGSVQDANPDHWKKMFDINVLGLMSTTQAVLPFMKKQNSGHIINISSVAGRVVSSRSAAYSATKFAVCAFSEGLRQEVFKNGIRVTVIEPGAVLTELVNHIQDAGTKEAVEDWVKSMTALKSEDIASAILYAIQQPQHVSVNEILIRPTEQGM